MANKTNYDAIIVGAGPAGMTAAIALANRGGRLALLEMSDDVGGAMRINRGQLSGAGTKLQAEQGISDTPQEHFDDAMRLSRGTSDPDFLKLAVELQGPFIDWLMEHGFDMEDNMPCIIHGNEAYNKSRTYWGRELGISLIKTLKPMLDEKIEAGKIDLLLHTEARELIADNGKVTGLKTADGLSLYGRSIVLASGGYAANPELFAQLHDGATLWSGSYEYSTGQGIEMGQRVGANVVLADTLLPNFGGFLDHTLDTPRYRAPGGLTPQDRQPWEIVVNRQGKRFYPEDNESVDERTVRLLEQENSQAWVIFDQTIRQSAPTIFSFFPDMAERFFEPESSMENADSLEELADKCGIDKNALMNTVSRYNMAVEKGVDDEFGRKHMPVKIENGPFYALPIVSYTVRGYAGLKVDLKFRALDEQDEPIEGLYAVGEILGSLLSGKGSVGGMSLAPALAFGQYLGEILPVDPV